jgi:hypothetical protein
MNKKAKLPYRQTFIYPAGLGTKSEVFYFCIGYLFVIGYAFASNKL